jgi:hypothetical protein
VKQGSHQDNRALGPVGMASREGSRPSDFPAIHFSMPRLQRGRMQNQIGTINQTNSVDWPAWAKGWGGVVTIAFLNGVLHRTYEGALGSGAPISSHRSCCWLSSRHGQPGPNVGIPFRPCRLPCKLGCCGLRHRLHSSFCSAIS